MCMRDGTITWGDVQCIDVITVLGIWLWSGSSVRRAGGRTAVARVHPSVPLRRGPTAPLGQPYFWFGTASPRLVSLQPGSRQSGLSPALARHPDVMTPSPRETY